MTAERITVSLPPEVLAEARHAVDTGAADNLSAFVADALRDRLSRAHALSELTRVLGGPPHSRRGRPSAELGDCPHCQPTRGDRRTCS